MPHNQNPTSGETLIFTCAGAAHSGQVANRVGVQMRQQGDGALFCLAAVAAEIPDKLERTHNAGRRIVVDGCEDCCCQKVMQQANIPVDVAVVLADLGIEKQPTSPDLIGDTKKALRHVQDRIG